MAEQKNTWQATRERLVYRYLTALQEEDIDTVREVLAKAEQDATLEEMLWQIHQVDLQTEMDIAEAEPVERKGLAELPARAKEDMSRQSAIRPKTAARKFWRASRMLQTLAASIAVCVLVGAFLVVLSAHHTTIVGSGPAPNCFASAPSPQVNGWLVSVAAVSANDAWAVGGQHQPNSNVTTTLIEHWDGQRWQIVASQNAPGADNTLVAITAISATDIWAVGQTANASSSSVTQAQTLIEHWNGQSWQIVPSANMLQNAVNTLTGISAVNARDIWAVGIVDLVVPQAGTPRSQTLIEHWNGQRWQLVSDLNTDIITSSGGLFGVAALAQNNVWAVGNKAGKLFSEHWNGQTWQEVASPALPGSFTGISALNANDIWAVGNNGAIEHWNGQSWQLAMRDAQYTLNAVVARAPDDVWVVGNIRSSTLIGHWNGKNWSFTHTAQPASSPLQTDDFNGIAATPTGKILVVGFHLIVSFQHDTAQNTQRPITKVSTCS